MKDSSPKPHGFCVTPNSNCTMNYCDDNGCQDRKRELVLVEGQEQNRGPADFLNSNGLSFRNEIQNKVIVAMQEYGAMLVNQQRHLMQKHLNMRNVPKPKI